MPTLLQRTVMQSLRIIQAETDNTHLLGRQFYDMANFQSTMYGTIARRYCHSGLIFQNDL